MEKISVFFHSKIFIGLVMGSVAAVVGYAFFLVGNPSTQRAIQLDQRRISDLQTITYAIDGYWATNKELPQTFEDLRDTHFYINSITDPRTGERYEYRVISDTERRYELCAIFETDSLQKNISVPKPFSEETWTHGIGRACFVFTVQESQNPAAIPPRSVLFLGD